ncbi:Oligopeptide transport system permease protein [Methylophaga frappieri]|uniref:Oligopeptide transport system permease protein n=1 Tax=Methylophaga frappieri (strain ATCC BAA-2434 / DSM 25690 / JAM7) TaxID=754477 RepID=I1YEG6_METFJ|nr:ABC transporter permease [Methylophaga frappieri]AFJ01309.1 Oligopeptide transport system permease protein [Methylophaga frappieri]
MAFLPVFLWTDILLFTLLAATVLMVIYIRRKPHLCRPWKQVFSTSRGMISSLILLVFIGIGVADSLHFRLALQPTEEEASHHFHSDVLSVLDLILTPLRSQVEKTYSAPFAHQQFTKEMIQNEGSLHYGYPDLKYGGQHLTNPADKLQDIANKSAKASLFALGATLTMIALWLSWLCWHRASSLRDVLKRYWSDEAGYPVTTAWLTLFLILLFASNLLYLGQFYHVLGTDKVGQDVLYQTLKSIRTGLLIGSLTTLIMLPMAVTMGIAAGYFRGWIDDLIQYIYTTLNAIPGVLLIAAAVLMLQVYINNHPQLFTTAAERADIRLLFLCLILGVTSWTGLCRILRSETLKLREAEYVQAAKALGVPGPTILHRHILPNLMHIVLITVVLDFSGLVLAEAVLSYVGVGVDPTMISWGNMINSARLEMARDPIVWWSLVAAFIFMFLLVLAANLFADSVRDAFDPRHQVIT